MDLRTGYEVIEAAADPERPVLVYDSLLHFLQTNIMFWSFGIVLPLFNVYSLTSKWLDLPHRDPDEPYNWSKRVLGWTEFSIIFVVCLTLVTSAVGMMLTWRSRFNAASFFHKWFFPSFLWALDTLKFSCVLCLYILVCVACAVAHPGCAHAQYVSFARCGQDLGADLADGDMD